MIYIKEKKRVQSHVWSKKEIRSLLNKYEANKKG
jgi:hypothetical protein